MNNTIIEPFACALSKPDFWDSTTGGIGVGSYDPSTQQREGTLTFVTNKLPSVLTPLWSSTSSSWGLARQKQILFSDFGGAWS